MCKDCSTQTDSLAFLISKCSSARYLLKSVDIEYTHCSTQTDPMTTLMDQHSLDTTNLSNKTNIQFNGITTNEANIINKVSGGTDIREHCPSPDFNSTFEETIISDQELKRLELINPSVYHDHCYPKSDKLLPKSTVTETNCSVCSANKSIELMYPKFKWSSELVTVNLTSKIKDLMFKKRVLDLLLKDTIIHSFIHDNRFFLISVVGKAHKFSVEQLQRSVYFFK